MTGAIIVVFLVLNLLTLVRVRQLEARLRRLEEPWRVRR